MNLALCYDSQVYYPIDHVGDRNVSLKRMRYRKFQNFRAFRKLTGCLQPDYQVIVDQNTSKMIFPYQCKKRVVLNAVYSTASLHLEWEKFELFYVTTRSSCAYLNSADIWAKQVIKSDSQWSPTNVSLEPVYKLINAEKKRRNLKNHPTSSAFWNLFVQICRKYVCRYICRNVFKVFSPFIWL